MATTKPRKGSTYAEYPEGWRARLTIDGTTYTAKGRKQRDAVDQIATQSGIRFDDVRALLKAATKARPNRGSRSQLDGFDGIGEPKWYGQYIDAQGHRRKVSGRTSDEVSRKLRRKLNAAEDGLPTGHGNMTVGELIELWFGRVKEGLQPLYVDGHHWEQVTPSTQSRYEWITTMLSDEYGRVRLKDLDADRVELGLKRIAAGRYGKSDAAGKPTPLARTTVVRVRSVLRTMLGFAVRRHFVAFNAADDAGIARTTSPPRTTSRISLSADQAVALFEACEGWHGPQIRFMLLAGIRPGEAAGMKWDAIDFDAGTVAIHTGLQRNARGKPLLVDRVKNDQSVRTIALTEPMLEVLRTKRAQIAETRLAVGTSWDDRNLVFPTMQGRPAYREVFAKSLVRTCRKAGVPDIRPHELRHTAATLMSRSGMTPETIKDVLGHHPASRTYESTYRHRADVVTTSGTLDFIADG